MANARERQVRSLTHTSESDAVLAKDKLIFWWRWEELNLRHGAYETPALPLSYTAGTRRPVPHRSDYHAANGI